MTITYPDGTCIRAMLLSRSADTMRVALEGDDDARSFVCVNGTWVSEDAETVVVTFEWEKTKSVCAPPLSDCICSQELAAQLISRLLDPEGDTLEEMLSALSAADLGGDLPRFPMLVN